LKVSSTSSTVSPGELLPASTSTTWSQSPFDLIP
jgi:hypothetical protein